MSYYHCFGLNCLNFSFHEDSLIYEIPPGGLPEGAPAASEKGEPETKGKLEKATSRFERETFDEKTLEKEIEEVEEGLRNADKPDLKRFIEKGINYTGSYRDLNNEFCESILEKPGLTAGEQVKYAAALQLYLMKYIGLPVFKQEVGFFSLDGKIHNYTTRVLAVYWNRERKRKMQEGRYITAGAIDVSYQGSKKGIEKAFAYLDEQLGETKEEKVATAEFEEDNMYSAETPAVPAETPKKGENKEAVAAMDKEYPPKTAEQVIQAVADMGLNDTVKFQTGDGRKLEIKYAELAPYIKPQYQIILAGTPGVLSHDDNPAKIEGYIYDAFKTPEPKAQPPVMAMNESGPK